MPEPCGDRWNVYAGLDRGGGEGVAQIVMGQTFDAELLAGTRKRFPGLANRENLALEVSMAAVFNGRAGGKLAGSVKAFQQGLGRRNQRHFPIGRFRLASVDVEDASLEIHITPSHALGLAQPTSGVGQKTTEIGGIAGESTASPLDFREDLRELVRFRQIRLPWCILELEPPRVKRVAGQLATLNGDVEHTAQSIDAFIDE